MLLLHYHAGDRDPRGIPNRARQLYPTYVLQSKYGDIYWLKTIAGKSELLCCKKNCFRPSALLLSYL